MPSAFDNDFDAGPLNAIYARMGVPGCAYEDKTQKLSALSVRIHRHPPVQMIGKENRVSGEAQTADCFVRQSEVAKPARGGRFTVDGEVWSIEVQPVLLRGQFTCTCSRVSADRRGEQRGAANG